MDEYVKEHGFAGWFETSAKENINIEEAARALVSKVWGIFRIEKILLIPCETMFETNRFSYF